MGNLIDLTGQVFGKWKVIERDNTSTSAEAKWIANCECGNIRSILGATLRRKKSLQCRDCANLCQSIDISGEQFGNWTVLSNDNNSPRKGAIWICQCACGNVSNILSQTLRSKKSLQCKDCRLDKHPNICNYFFSAIKSRAKSRGILFEINKECLWTLFLNQNKKCIFCDRKLVILSDGYRNGNIPNSHASLDRIDSYKNYTKTNIQWTCKPCNIAKNCMSNENYIKLCESVAKNNVQKV